MYLFVSLFASDAGGFARRLSACCLDWPVACDE